MADGQAARLLAVVRQRQTEFTAASASEHWKMELRFDINRNRVLLLLVLASSTTTTSSSSAGASGGTTCCQCYSYYLAVVSGLLVLVVLVLSLPLLACQTAAPLGLPRSFTSATS
jgi:hypothetical protein